MPLTPPQLKLLQTARSKLGLTEPQYRTILRSVGHVDSSKDLTNESFEEVMAHLEESSDWRQLGPCGEQLSDHYWRGKVERRGRFGGDRASHKIEALAIEAGYAEGLGGFLMRLTEGRCDQVTKLTPAESYDVIEALKAIVERKRRAAEKLRNEPLLFGDKDGHEARPRPARDGAAVPADPAKAEGKDRRPHARTRAAGAGAAPPPPGPPALAHEEDEDDVPF